MRIGLISPKGAYLGRNPAFEAFYSSTARLESYRRTWSGLGSGLLVLGALTPPEHEVVLIDEQFDTVEFSNDFDLVAISAMTQQATRAYEIADTFRALHVPVIVGGLHATLMADEAQQHADAVCVGEAEYLWPTVLRDAQAGTMQPVYRSDGPVALSDSPIPRYDLLESNTYHTVWVQTTRGCPHDCDFCACSTVFGPTYRHKGIEQVVEELRRVKSVFGKVFIGFGDDNMLVNRRFAARLLEAIIPLRIRWTAQTDISVAEDDALLELVRRSGCAHLFIGLESVSEKALREVDGDGWKAQRVEQYPHHIKRIQSHGIGVMGAFIVGLDADDDSVFERTRTFILDNRLYEAQVSILTPFPGTRVRDRLAAEGRILPTKWESYTAFDVNFVHKTLSKDQLEEGVLGIYRALNTESVHLDRLAHFRDIHRELVAGRPSTRG